MRKRKTRYLETTPTLRSLGELEVVRSEVLARVGVRAPWVDAVTVDEELRVGAAADPRLHVVVRARLEAVDGARDPGPPPVGPVQAEPRHVARPDGGSASGAADLAGVSGRLRQAGAGAAEIRDLTLLLGRWPALAADIALLLRDATLPEASAVCIIDALGAVGSPEAQAGLARTLLDPEVRATRRRRAVIVIGGVERPTDEARDALWRIWSGGSDAPAVDLGPPAALALGRMADRLRASDAPGHAATRDRLVAELRSEREPVRASVLLKALGNDPDPAITSSVVPYLSADAPLVRAAAADTLGLVGGEEASLQLAVRLSEEPTDWVRQKAAEGLLAIADPPAIALRSVIERLATEGHAGTRLALARIAARAAGADPAARAALEALLVSERDDAIRAVATRALAPAQSPGAR